MKRSVTATALCLSLAAPLAAPAQDMAFGTDEDADYAGMVWEMMENARLVGADMVHHLPYEGTDPHGMMLETFYTTATIDGHSGDLIVKRNYGPEGVGAEEVLADPEGHLGAITIMFRRADGYAPDSCNWFWAKYLPDGALDQSPDGARLAGKVAGCIACHQGAGEGMVFTSSHLAE